MKEINLIKILEEECVRSEHFGQDTILNAMREVANQCFDLAAEEAETMSVSHSYEGVRAGGNYYVREVNKDSILKLKDRVK